MVAQQGGQALGRAVAVGGDDDAVAVGEQLGQAARRAPTPSPTTGPSPTPARAACRATPASSRSSTTRAAPGEEPVGLGVQARERLVGVALPRRGQRLGEVVLLGEQVDRPGRASGAARRARPWRVAGRTSVSSCSVVRRATAASSPCRRTGRPRRAAPTARGPTARRRRAAAARARTSSVGISSRAGKMQRLGEVVDRALVVDAEAGQAVDLVAPQVDADRACRRSTGRRR